MIRGSIIDEGDVTRAVLAIVRGASVDVVVPPSSGGLVAALLDALGRLGMDLTVAERRASAGLDEGDLRLLLLLGRGASIDEAGRELGLSRRTTQRRLEAARRRLGVSTNREAIGRVTAGSEPPARSGQ